MSVIADTRSTKVWQGINEALTEEMERDERVVLVGEDVGRPGGPYGVTRGLRDRFGDLRVRDTPISEAVLVGLGVGGAAVGLRPVVEIMFFDFAMIAMDQIVNQAAKYRYFSGESMPLVIRTMCGAGGPNGAQHSQNFEAWYSAVPGLKVVMPSNAADAKGLLKSAIRDDDPVLFIETLGLLAARREVPATGDFPSCRSAWPTSGARARTSPSSRSGDWWTAPWKRPRPWQARACRSRCSTPARCRRWTPRPSSTACGAPGVWSWPRRPPRRTRSRPRSARSPRNRACPS